MNHNTSHSFWWHALLLGVVALSLRLSVAELLLQRNQSRLADSELFVHYSQQIAAGLPFCVGTDYAQRTPGYPLFLAFCWWWIGQSPDGLQVDGRTERAVLWFQAWLGTGVVGLTWLLAQRLEAWGLPRCRWLAAWLVALEPFSLVFSGMLLSECLFGFVLGLAVWLTVRLLQSDSRRHRLAFLLGSIWAVTVLIKPSALLLPVFAFAVTLCFCRPASREQWWPWVLVWGWLGVGFVLCMAPWWIRNASHFGTFVPTALNGGISLYDGWNPKADGSSAYLADSAAARQQWGIPEAELERDRWFRDQALTFAWQHPGRVAQLAVIKQGRFWSPWANANQFQQPIVALITTAYTLPVYLAALLGWWYLRARPAVWLTCLLPIGYFALLHSVFVGSIRYRIPAMPMLIILAAAGTELLWQRWRTSYPTHSRAH